MEDELIEQRRWTSRPSARHRLAANNRCHAGVEGLTSSRLVTGTHLQSTADEEIGVFFSSNVTNVSFFMTRNQYRTTNTT